MRILKKSLVIFVLLSAVFTSFVSCDRDYDENEVVSVAEALIKKSAILEDILFGEGFSPDSTDTSSSTFKRADERSIKKYEGLLGKEIKKLDDLRALIANVYTPGYANDIYSGVLYGSIDSNTRYYEDFVYETDINGKEVQTPVIMVDTTYKIRKKDDIQYHYSTLKVVDVNGEKITVAIEVTVTQNKGASNEKKQNKTIEIDLIEDATGWRLDTPTFAVYNEDADKIKELENELNNR